MFQVKICGITEVDDARAVAAAGADAVGLNFYPQSPRYVSPEQAQPIVDALPEGVVKVGVFVNAQRQEVCELFDSLGLDLIQLHGEEAPAYVSRLGGRPTVKAFRLNETDRLFPMTDYLQECRALGCLPRMALVDALIPGLYGGTGVMADWTMLQDYPTQWYQPPLALAGGLTPQNVVEAVNAVRPAAVDTASGVERSVGRKDASAVKAFVRAARYAFDHLPQDEDEPGEDEPDEDEEVG